MEIVFLDAKTLGSDVSLEKIKEFGTLTIYETTLPHQTKERISSADIVITNKVVIDKELMQSAKNLKLICVAATGMNNIDLDAAKEFGIEVKNVAGYSTNSVVQHTFAMLFYLLEHLRYYDEFVKSGAWEQSQIFTNVSRPFYEIKDKKWGIIGLGAIGKEVARVATSFGANVSYYSTSGQNKDASYPHRELDELLLSSDIISIHAPLNEKTKNLLNASNLSLLKEKAILLNLGRGGIINETDLAKIIDEKEIYAGLDVTSKEPLPKSSPLMQIKHKERLFITPHIAWTSIEARKKLIEGIYQNIKEFVRSMND